LIRFTAAAKGSLFTELFSEMLIIKDARRREGEERDEAA